MRTLDEGRIERILDYIKGYVKHSGGESPSLTEIVEHMGLSKATVYRSLLELDRRGALEYSGKNTLRLKGQERMRCAHRSIPIVGRIVCGSPDEQEEYVSGYLTIPDEWTDGECFLLEAYGDSMIDIGIRRGDLVLVKKTDRARDGQVVVALTENGNTLKRIFFDNGRPRLHAENKEYSPSERDFYPEQLSIQGVALKVIRNID